MPLIATRAAASSRGFGQQQGGGLSPYDIEYLLIAGGGGGGNGRNAGN